MIHIDNTYYDPWVLGCVCVRAQSYLTLCNPMDFRTLGSSVHGIFQARILEWVAIPTPGDLSGPTQVSNPCLLHLLCLLHWQMDFFFFNHCTTWEASRSFGGQIIINS